MPRVSRNIWKRVCIFARFFKQGLMKNWSSLDCIAVIGGEMTEIIRIAVSVGAKVCHHCNHFHSFTVVDNEFNRLLCFDCWQALEVKKRMKTICHCCGKEICGYYIQNNKHICHSCHEKFYTP